MAAKKLRKDGSFKQRQVINDHATKIDAANVVAPGTPAFTVGTEAANAIAVSIQLKDLAGTNLAAKTLATVWISDTAAAAPSGTPPDGTVSVSTGVRLKEDTTKVLHRILSDATGVIALSIGESTAKSFYVNVVVGSGPVASQVVTFA